jgi:hypothetical protein
MAHWHCVCSLGMIGLLVEGFQLPPAAIFRGESKDQDMNFSAIRASCIMHHHRIMFHRVTPIGSEARNRGFTIPWVARRLRPAFIRHVYGIVNCIGRYDCWQPWRLAWVSLVVRKVTPFQDHRCHCDVCNTSSRLCTDQDHVQ